MFTVKSIKKFEALQTIQAYFFPPPTVAQKLLPKLDIVS